MSEVLTVNEIFLSIQGEGVRAGRPCAMVRLTGCDLRCRWCDTRYAYREGQPMAIGEVVDRVRELGCPLVEVTGGEPLLQPLTPKLLATLCDDGLEVLLETSGVHDIAVVDERVSRIVDMKCPSSGHGNRFCWSNVTALRSKDEVKFVIADRRDYDFACAMIGEHRLAGRCTVLLGAVAGELAPAELAGWILADRLPVRLNLQWHKILWPHTERGV